MAWPPQLVQQKSRSGVWIGAGLVGAILLALTPTVVIPLLERDSYKEKERAVPGFEKKGMWKQIAKNRSDSEGG